MIKSLDDFKTATKRIPKILQTFDLTKPDAFRLSNSAALNFMARILGYENYNTIKPVFEKNHSKGNKKMKFIKIDEYRQLSIGELRQYNKHTDNDGTCTVQLLTNIEEINAGLVDYNFNTDDKAIEMLDAINNFIDNDETRLDLHALYSKLQNVDNRSNQLNPNNSHT